MADASYDDQYIDTRSYKRNWDFDADDESDENGREIDYPDEDEDEYGYGYEDNTNSELNEDGSDDTIHNQNRYLYYLHNEIMDEDGDGIGNTSTHRYSPVMGYQPEDETMQYSSRMATCCICAESKSVYFYRMDELDHHPTSMPSSFNVIANPCKNHFICVSCIKSSLINNTIAILKDGQGNFPCLGDSECKNSLHQRTTTFLYQLRELFTDEEWRPISQLVKVFNTTVSNHHHYITPLTSHDALTIEHIYRHIQYLMNQDHPRVQCPICMVTIQKSTACFAIRHCDWEICWMCGKIERRLETRHWATCPRYDSNSFWKHVDYQCIEGHCYTEDRTCDRNVHSKGRMMMDTIRKAYQVVRFYMSLSPKFQLDLQLKLKTHNQWEEFNRHQKCYDSHVFETAR